MARHLKNIKLLIEQLNLDGILMKSKTSKKYLDTLTGSGVQVLITRDNSYMILDGRYLSEALERDDELIIIENTPSKSNKNHFDVVSEIFKEFKYSKLGIEANSYSISDYKKLRKYDFIVTLINDEINESRIIKDEFEINILKEACKITDEVFNNVLKHIKVGISENKINALINYYALEAGASRLSFDPVVTSGLRTAFPHGRPTNRIIKPNEPIMIDFGIEYKNYQSDMTRTIFLGKPCDELNNIYNIVKYAQQAGIDAIKSGVLASEVDFIVRDIIEKAGYGNNYNHGLGHGIGIGDGCEHPFLNQRSNTILKENMVMSCEPGIYVEGLGGVRIEDDVLISNGIGVPLTQTTKDMIILEVD